MILDALPFGILNLKLERLSCRVLFRPNRKNRSLNHQILGNCDWDCDVSSHHAQVSLPADGRWTSVQDLGEDFAPFR